MQRKSRLSGYGGYGNNSTRGQQPAEMDFYQNDKNDRKVAQRIFEKYDKDQDSELEKPELTKLLQDVYKSVGKTIDVKKKHLELFAKILDKDKDGHVSEKDVEACIVKLMERRHTQQVDRKKRIEAREEQSKLMLSPKRFAEKYPPPKKPKKGPAKGGLSRGASRDRVGSRGRR